MKQIDTEFFLAEFEVIHEPSKFTWRGGLLTLKQWMEMVSACNASAKDLQSEIMFRLYYNLVTNEWKTIMLPQTTVGMFVSEIEDDPRRNDLLNLSSDWTCLGSLHHHVDAEAYQSDTDHKDEVNQEGLHVTLGDMYDPIMSIDARYVIDGKVFPVEVSDFVEDPIGYNLDQILTLNVRERVFPEAWMELVLVEPRYKKVTQAVKDFVLITKKYNDGKFVFNQTLADKYKLKEEDFNYLKEVNWKTITELKKN